MNNLAPKTSWLENLRQTALSRFEKSGFPSPRAEEWRYTNISAIEKKKFPLATDEAVNINVELLKQSHISNCYHFVLINGFFNAEYSKLPENLTACAISQAFSFHADVISCYFGKAVEKENNGFIDFNTAHFNDGLFLHLSENQQLDKPLQIIHLSTQEAIANSRHCVILGKNAQAEIIETFIGLENNPYLTAAVLEGFMAENSALTLYKYQNESEKAFHFGGTYIQQAENPNSPIIILL
jgi:Fe-S cluster assembly protein SufD